MKAFCATLATICLYMICAILAVLLHIHPVKQAHEVKCNSQEVTQQRVTQRYRNCQMKKRGLKIAHTDGKKRHGAHKSLLERG